MKKKIEKIVIILLIVLGIILAWGIKNKDSLELNSENYINEEVEEVEKVEKEVEKVEKEVEKVEKEVEKEVEKVEKEVEKVEKEVEKVEKEVEKEVEKVEKEVEKVEKEVEKVEKEVEKVEKEVEKVEKEVKEVEKEVEEVEKEVEKVEKEVEKVEKEVEKVEIDINDPNFDLVIKSLDLEILKSYKLPILIDFGSEGCMPCKMMEPDLKAANIELRGKAIIKFIDVWEYPEAANGFNFSLIPTQFYFDKEGNLMGSHTGALTKDEIISIMKEMGMEE